MTRSAERAPRRRVQILTRGLLLAAGAATLAIMLWRIDWREPMHLVARGGPAMLTVPLSQLLLVALSTQGWRVLLRAGQVDRPWPLLYWLRLLADSINQLLPVAQLGGEWLRAHALGHARVPRPLAYASVLADMSIAVLTLVLSIATGLGALALRGGLPEAAGMLAGIAAFAMLLTGALIALQRGMLAAALKLCARLVPIAGGHGARRLATTTDSALRALYGDRRSLLCAAGWHYAAWVGGALQTWMALRLLGVDASLGDALIVEAVGQAMRNAGSFIPGSLGAHEAGYVLGSTLAGLPAAAGLALPMLRRLRDLATGLPVLLIWQVRNPLRAKRNEAIPAVQDAAAS